MFSTYSGRISDWATTRLEGYSDIVIAAATEKDMLFGIDMSIEGLRSQKYSQGIFAFLILSLIFFAFIIYMYMPKDGSLKLGEKIMFGALIAGLFIAVGMGYLQLIDGYLL
ncbi:hypothetical protein MNBD_GAMMA16-69 [hydrothermal vent metagenome]|uniref:Uncharacterized protein n=1 Tax=hydrothermal vent metagenome TaxID=652676 RepID=A0A3B0YY51_9ZZZZ